MAIEELADKVETLVKTAPKEAVLLTRNGQPFAFVSDASEYDWEDIGYMVDPEFWKMIRERRREKGGIPLEQIKARLEEDEKAEKQAAAARRAKAPKKQQRNKGTRPAA